MKRTHKFDDYFLNKYPLDGKYDMPILELQKISLDNLKLIRFSDIKKNDTYDLDATVHFFLYDDEFDEVWKNPKKYLGEIGQFKQTLTTDFSLYTNMPLSLQIFNVYRNRWLGCYWQENGLTVIPSVGWSDETSYDFCFDGIQKGAVVAVSTIGSYDIEICYLAGFRKMCSKIDPVSVICYGKAFEGMFDYANIIEIPYVANKRVAEAKGNY
jgi:hypothetical protein